MQKRRIGKTRVEISELALGTWGLAAEAYGPVDDSRFRRVVERAVERDVEAFDLAPLWGDGRSETIVADVVGDARPEVNYITRAGARWSEDGELETSFESDALERDLDGSLDRLATDRIDVWLLHNPSAEEMREHSEPIQKLVHRVKKDKRVRAFGVSVATDEQARAALDLEGVDVLCMPYNMLNRFLLHELAADLDERGVTVIARSILSYGILSGRWGESRTFSDLDHRKHRWKKEAIRTRVRQVNRLRFLVHGEVGSLVSASMRFVLANNLVSAAIVGPRSTGQLHELLGYVKDGPPYLPEFDIHRVGSVLKEATTI